MSVQTLFKTFRRLHIGFRTERMGFHNSLNSTENLVKINPVNIKLDSSPKLLKNDISFTPYSVHFNFNVPKSELPLNKIIKCPLISNFRIHEPIMNNIQKIDIGSKKVIEMPPTTAIIEKRAVRMIIIRRKKMKRHKRRKFLKRMKFVIRKREINKKILKEKRFEAELEATYKEALNFDAKEYVAQRLKVLTEERLPTKWRGEVLPENMIKQFIEEKKAKREYKHRLRTYRLKAD